MPTSHRPECIQRGRVSDLLADIWRAQMRPMLTALTRRRLESDHSPKERDLRVVEDRVASVANSPISCRG